MESQSSSSVPATTRVFPGVSQVRGPRGQVRASARGTWRRPGDFFSRVGGWGAAARPLFPRAGLLGWALGDGHSRELGGGPGRATLRRRRPQELSRLPGRGASGAPFVLTATYLPVCPQHTSAKPGSCQVPKHRLRCARGQVLGTPSFPGVATWKAHKTVFRGS